MHRLSKLPWKSRIGDDTVTLILLERAMQLLSRKVNPLSQDENYKTHLQFVFPERTSKESLLQKDEATMTRANILIPSVFPL